MKPIRHVCRLVVGLVVLWGLSFATPVQAGPPGQPTDWQRFYHYPYVYYPHNFQKQPESYDNLYHRYPTEKRIPVYRSDWYNFYPSDKPYHWGHHYILDVF